jgi:hypothetical protein
VVSRFDESAFDENIVTRVVGHLRKARVRRPISMLLGWVMGMCV